MFGKMRNHADELVKLAGLRADRAVDGVECDMQKAKVGPWACSARLAMVELALALIAFGVCFALTYARVDDTPDCDAERVRQKVVELANPQSQLVTESALSPLQSAAAADSPTRVSSVTNGRTLFYDKDSSFRACVANAAIERGHAPIEFTIEWHDKDGSEYLVELSNAATLEARCPGSKGAE